MFAKTVTPHPESLLEKSYGVIFGGRTIELSGLGEGAEHEFHLFLDPGCSKYLS